MAKNRKRSTSAAQSTFSSIESVNRPRSTFNLSKKVMTTFFAADIIPVGLFEVLPGDTAKISTANFCRMSTPIHPLMDDLFIDLHWWYVPNRIVWDNFAKMMGEQANPGDSIDYTVPQIQFSANQPAEGSLADYFGIPTRVGSGFKVSSIPFRAYNKIWTEWYRAEDLQDSALINTDDATGEVGSSYPIRRRGKRKGYLSAALPFPQKGDPVEINIGGQAPVVFPTDINVTAEGSATPTWNIGSGPSSLAYGNLGNDADWTNNASNGGQATWADPALEVRTSLIGDAYANLEASTAVNVNDLRQAFAVQHLLERDARGGTRQQEQNLAHFGVLSNDQRLNRPEYLGGTTQAVNVHTVPQTTPDSPGGAVTGLGTTGAYGTSGNSGKTIVRSVTEHGYMMCLASTRSELTYQQGLERHWSRQGKFDYYWPDLSGLGEQPILSKEIYLSGDPSDTEDNSVWGYIGRFDEYRTAMNNVTGAFRSNHPAPLDSWHLALSFQERPVLDDTFIQEDPPMFRVLATGDSEPHFIGDFRHNIQITRVMPLRGTPGLDRL